MIHQPGSPLTYQDAGVDIQTGDDFVSRIKPIAQTTQRPEVIAGLGGFGALFDLAPLLKRYQDPILVSGTDGVGTKLKLAQMLGCYDTIGIDLVAMCANDLAVLGAEVLFFLDYIAMARLAPNVGTEIVKGIALGCNLAGASLIGGETAEMPGLYQMGDFDLAGFAVGIVERQRITQLKEGAHVGDALIGIASDGCHSNGFSLIRHILDSNQIPLDTPFDGRTLGEVLLDPTRLYVKTMLSLFERFEIHAAAHITGGGLVGNLPRVMSSGTVAYIDPTLWPKPAVFGWLQKQGNVAESEMFRVFNCGVGMVIAVPAQQALSAVEHLRNEGEKAWRIGEIRKHSNSPDAEPVVQIHS